LVQDPHGGRANGCPDRFIASPNAVRRLKNQQGGQAAGKLPKLLGWSVLVAKASQKMAGQRMIQDLKRHGPF